VDRFWPLFVFVVLILAALLTAFYTARLVFLTFAGRPRTEAARHAPESVPSMTWPLIILAIFSTVLGLFGMPWANHFYNLLGKHATVVGEEIVHGEFTPLIAGISLLVAGLGWFFGWQLYGRKPLVEAVDPLEKPLGPVYTLLKNRYYIDQFYQKFIVRPVIALGKAAYAFDDRLVIDPIVDAVGRFGRWLSEALKKFVDNPIVDGAVNGIGRVTTAFGEFMRATQTGQIQNYLLVAAVTVLLLLALFLVRG
jgi:NADH-quinone oxidoreductase subunit L